MRLDAVASAGFSMSRSKMGELIDGGDVKVNWKPVVKKDHEASHKGSLPPAGRDEPDDLSDNVAGQAGRCYQLPGSGACAGDIRRANQEGKV